MGCCDSRQNYPGGANINRTDSNISNPIPKPRKDINGVETPSIQINSDSARSTQKQGHILMSGQLAQATYLFENEKYEEAAQIYKKYIEGEGEKQPGQIDGLGQIQLSLGYYQWFLYRHYKEGIQNKIYLGTPYDALSLCYRGMKGNEQGMEKGIEWYRNMVDDYPDNYALIMGYANILNNKGIFQEALDYYNRVHKMKPQWVRPLQCIAFIYEYKRVLKTKSKEIAKKILEIDSNNRVAYFILARNQGTADEKINMLKMVTQKHPQYARAFNEIGIQYGGTKRMYEEAIVWYEKASKVAPEYSSCYNNIGVNLEMMKKYEDAIKWYFKGIQKDKEYKAPHSNLSDIFDKFKLSDAKISSLMQQYTIQPDYFYYEMGLAYYDKRNYSESIRYYMKAYDCLKELKNHIYKLHNSTGITYDDMKKNVEAISYYGKAIQANPKYHTSYYNTAIVYKRENNIEKAIEWYKKAIEVNPRYSYAYNNLANIYKNQKNYEQAIKNYKYAVKHLSTYTLALANMGVCYLKLQNYREAFNAMERAQQCLPTDNNNLSKANRAFLNENLKMFKNEGQMWRQNGCITSEQRSKLKNLISSFEGNFKTNILGSIMQQPVSQEKTMKNEILKIVEIVCEDQFELINIDKIFIQVKKLFQDNQQYFEIIPELFLQYFSKNAFIKNRSILEIQNDLKAATKRLEKMTVLEAADQEEAQITSRKNITLQMEHFKPPTQKKVNLFRTTKFFDNYEQVFAEVFAVNEQTKKSYPQFKSLVDYVRKQSYGTLFGIGMKLPKDQRYQFKVLLRIFQKMFKQEMTEARVNQMISKIDKNIKSRTMTAKGNHKFRIIDVMHMIRQNWTKEITEIVKTRKKAQKQTKFEVSDLLRGKIMFQSLDHIKKAIEGVDKICFENKYQVIEMTNRLMKIQTQDVVFKIKIKDAVCELQLALNQQMSKYYLNHAIYEILRSPLGCVFGSYILKSKGVHYPFITNCKDIVRILEDKKQKTQEENKWLQSAKYIYSALVEDVQQSKIQ